MQNRLNPQQSLNDICDDENITLKMLTDELEKDTDLNIQDGFGRTPFHYLCGNIKATQEMITVMLEKKADLNITNFWGNTPFHILCDNKNATHDMLAIMLEKNAYPNVDNVMGNTPFHYLCDNTNVTQEKIAVMLEKNADPNIKNNNRWTPFHNLCLNRVYPEMIAVMLEKNADLYSQDICGDTSLHTLLINPNISPKNLENIIMMLRLNGYINDKTVLLEQFKPHREFLEKPLVDLFKLEHMKLMTKDHRDKFKNLILSYKNKFASSPLLILPKPILKMIVFEYVALIDKERQECRNAVQNRN